MTPEVQIFQKLKKLSGSKSLIICIGQILKGDDAIGPLLAEKLKSQISAEIIDAGTVPENYIQPIIKKSPKSLLIIDAIDFAAEPGTINVFLPEQLNSTAFSTHTLSPRLFINLVKDRIDVSVYVIGIQPAQLRFGQPLSKPVNNALNELVEILTKIFPPQQSTPDISVS
jgi:hydrogenase 3 maturation protease